MNTKEMTQEQISALVDGELSDCHVDMALATLRQPDGHAVWDAYHQIGDVLRSDEMAVALSADFATRIAARLQKEPTIVAPVTATKHLMSDSAAPAKRALRHWGLSATGAAMVAAIAFLATPQLMVALKGNSGNSTLAPTMLASAAHTAASNVSDSMIAASESRKVQVNVATVSQATAAASGAIILRDPRIDDYLLAHQRFSPSVYSTAQYARSAAFATDSDK